MDPLIQEEASMQSPSIFSYIFYPITFALQFLAAYGWYLVGAGIGAGYLYNKLRPRYVKWKEAREDAEYHKDPDKALARMEAVQLARERQQQMLVLASQRALEQQKQLVMEIYFTLISWLTRKRRKTTILSNIPSHTTRAVIYSVTDRHELFSHF